MLKAKVAYRLDANDLHTATFMMETRKCASPDKTAWNALIECIFEALPKGASVEK